jgi:trigger factor
MNISFQNIDKVSGMLTLKVEKADYQEAVEKQLKVYKHKVQMPGFRPGMVPAGLIRKMYFRPIMAEEINKLVSSEIYKYIKDNGIHILGEPLSDEEKQQDIDFEMMEEFEFVFDVALAPQMEVKLSADDKIDYYSVEITDAMVDERVNAYTAQHGKYVQVDEYAPKDMLKGALTELAADGTPKEGGLHVDSAVMMPEYMKDEAQQALFVGSKVGSTVVFNPSKAYKEVAEIASLLQIEKEAAEEMKADFSYTVEEITRYTPAALDQELFDAELGEGVAKTEAEFRAKIKELIAKQYEADSDFKFLLDLRTYLKGKVQAEYSEPLMKRLMQANNPDKDDAFIEENYAKSIDLLTWQLIKEQLVTANGITVEQNDIQAAAREEMRARFARYGMMRIPDDLLDTYAKDMLNKKEEVEQLVDRVIDTKLSTALKPQVTLVEKSVSIEDFQKLFETQNA